MLIFIKDKPVDFVHQLNDSFLAQNEGSKLTLDKEIDNKDIANLSENLKGKVLIKKFNGQKLFELLDFLSDPKNENPELLVIECIDKNSIKKAVKSYFEVIEAAGGIIRNDENKLLLIKRLGKWDLPKGKKEKGESSIQTAQREVEEECNIKVKVGKKVVTSWHTYSLKNHKMLKRTRWYDMQCISDKKMKPQKEEGIEAIAWKSDAELKVCMQNTYASIAYIIANAEQKSTQLVG